MKTERNPWRATLWLVLVLFGLSNLTAPIAQAGMISVERYAQSDTRAQQTARVEAFVQREDVRAHLVEWGVDPRAAQERVARLSDRELAQAASLAEAPAGAGVVGAIVLIFVVLLITDILGYTDVFTFVR